MCSPSSSATARALNGRRLARKSSTTSRRRPPSMVSTRSHRQQACADFRRTDSVPRRNAPRVCVPPEDLIGPPRFANAGQNNRFLSAAETLHLTSTPSSSTDRLDRAHRCPRAAVEARVSMRVQVETVAQKTVNLALISAGAALDIHHTVQG